ncbi:MAG: hypothetical protein RL577_1515 [Bacteroidota bacterium]
MQEFKRFAAGAIAAVVSFSLQAQLSIGRTHMPKAGDSLRYSTALPTALPANWQSQVGASQTWDFGSLSSQAQTLVEYKSSLQTPYAFYFFGQIGLKTADSLGAGPLVFKNIYSFYSVSNSAFRAEGIGYSFSGFPLAANYVDEDEIYQFPLEYGDRDTSTFRFVFEVPGNAFRLVQQGVRQNAVLGYGSIKLPGYTSSNALLVRSTVLEVDTLTTQFGQVPIPRNQVSYKWLTDDQRLPVLEISGTPTGPRGFTPNQVRYYEPKMSGSTELPLYAMRVYPNPSTGIVNLPKTATGYKIELWSFSGQLLAQWPVGTERLDLSNYSSGLYLLKYAGYQQQINLLIQ